MFAQDACFWETCRSHALHESRAHVFGLMMFAHSMHGAKRFLFSVYFFCIMPPRRYHTETLSARSFIELKHLSNNELCALRKRLLNDANALEAIKSSSKDRLEKESKALFELIAADPIKYEMSDGVFTLEHWNPSLMVQLVTQQAPPLAALYLDKFSTKPCTREAPWHAIIRQV